MSHTEHTSVCMSEWGEATNKVVHMNAETVEMNHRLHMHDEGIHNICPPSCPDYIYFRLVFQSAENLADERNGMIVRMDEASPRYVPGLPNAYRVQLPDGTMSTAWADELTIQKGY